MDEWDEEEEKNKYCERSTNKFSFLFRLVPSRSPTGELISREEEEQQVG